MIKVLFICHGNICRSPMAEFILIHMFKKAGLDGDCLVDSMATSYEEIGNPVHHGTRQVLKEHGIKCLEHRAARMRREDYDRYDLILGMDTNNIRNIMRIIGDDPDNKVHLLLDYSENPRDIADPWYTGDFDTTYADITEGCEALIKHLYGKKV